MNTEIENKIRKLLALAGNNPSQAEAALALAKAQALMSEHHIEQLQIEHAEEAEDEFLWNDSEGITGALWRVDLCGALARANGCFIYRSGSSVAVVGKPSNARSTNYIFQFCITQIDNLSDRLAKGLGRAYVNSFKLGCVAAITEAIRLEKQASEAKMREVAAASNDCKALVRLDNALAITKQEGERAKAYAYAKHNLRSCKSKRSINGNGYNAGKAAGSSIYGSSRNSGTKRIGN